MGTNAVISLTHKGQTVAKIVAGCEGSIALEVASEVALQKSTRVEDLYRIAQRAGLGCPDCLIVMDDTKILPADVDPAIVAIYRQHFREVPTASTRSILTNGMCYLGTIVGSFGNQSHG